MRGARPGEPGRQTAGASSRTPHALPLRNHRRIVAGGDGRVAAPGAGHDVSCPYEETATAEKVPTLRKNAKDGAPVTATAKTNSRWGWLGCRCRRRCGGI